MSTRQDLIARVRATTEGGPYVVEETSDEGMCSKSFHAETGVEARTGEVGTEQKIGIVALVMAPLG